MQWADLVTCSNREFVQDDSKMFHVCTHYRRLDYLPYQISHFSLNTDADQGCIRRAKVWVQYPLICQNLRLWKKIFTRVVSNIRELETIIQNDRWYHMLFCYISLDVVFIYISVVIYIETGIINDSSYSIRRWHSLHTLQPTKKSS